MRSTETITMSELRRYCISLRILVVNGIRLQTESGGVTEKGREREGVSKKPKPWNVRGRETFFVLEAE